jgi:hypothetical protein
MNTNPNYPYQPVMQPMQRDSGAAIASLIFGIMAWVFLPFLGAIVAIITGHVGINEVNNSNGMVRGKGMAVAGLVMGYVQIAILVLIIVVLVLLAPTMGDVFSDINSSLYY